MKRIFAVVAMVGAALPALATDPSLFTDFLSLAPEGVIGLLATVGFALVGMAQTQRGALQQDATPSEIQYKDVSNMLTWRQPQASPLYVALRNLRKGPPAQQARINWQEQDTIPRNTTFDGAQDPTGSASFQYSVNDDIYQVDDVLQLVENNDQPNAILIVTDTGNGTITVAQVDGDEQDSYDAALPAVDDGELVVRLGNSKKEFFDASPYRSTYPVERYNYVQRVDETVGISNTKKATADYAGDSWQQNRDNQLYDFQTSRESTLFFGKRDRKTISGETRHWMGGIDDFGLNKQFSYSASSFSVSVLLDQVRQTFVGNTGSDIRYLHADSLMIQDIMELDQDKLRRSNYRSNLLRREIPEIQFGFGTVRIVHEQLFDEQERARLGFILDYQNLRMRELNPMKVVRNNLEQTQLKDGEAVQVKEECTLEMRYNDTHAKIEGSS
jgi:hypothetical protein